MLPHLFIEIIMPVPCCLKSVCRIRGKPLRQRAQYAFTAFFFRFMFIGFVAVILFPCIAFAQVSTKDGSWLWREIQSKIEKTGQFSASVASKFSVFGVLSNQPSQYPRAEYLVQVDGLRIRVEKILPKDDNRKVVVYMDEHLAYNRSSNDSATVNSHDSSSIFSPFGDPRLLPVGHTSAGTVRNWFDRHSKGPKLVSETEELVGKESFKRFVFTDSSEDVSKIVVLVDGKYRVHQFEHYITETSENGTFSQVRKTLSNFTNSFAGGEFPDKIIIETFIGEGHEASDLRYRQEFLFSNFEPKVTISKSGWAALDLPTGSTCSDLRIKRRVGYWNDDGSLSEDLPRNVGLAPGVEPADLKPKNQQGLGFWIFVSIGVTTLALALLLWYRGRDQKS